MLKFISGRLLDSIPVLVLSSLLVFSVMHLIPGDPVEVMLATASLGVGDPVQQKQIAYSIRQEMGLNQPLPLQYLSWIGNALRGDLGQSYVRQQPVATLIGQRLPSTIELAATSLVLSVGLGTVCGLLAAVRRNSVFDRLVMLVSLGGVSIPSFWFAMLMILIFSVGLRLVPATGSGGLDRLILPAIVLGYEGTGLIARLTRSCLLEVLGLDYIRTAWAKGLPNRAILLNHALRNALIPIITIVGLQLGRLLAGSVIVETVFARQGVGQLALDAILSKDYPLVQGIVLLIATSYVLTNVLVDVSYGLVDPRTRTA